MDLYLLTFEHTPSRLHFTLVWSVFVYWEEFCVVFLKRNDTHQASTIASSSGFLREEQSNLNAKV